MRSLGLRLLTLVVLVVLHPHHRGSEIVYTGVFIASVASWVALPGPGEAALIAAGIAAAHHRLDLVLVLAAAWAGAAPAAPPGGSSA